MTSRHSRRGSPCSKFLLALALAIIQWPIGQILDPASAEAQLIAVDPGHGGNDPGGSGNGMDEKDIVLDTSLRLLELLRSSGAEGGRNWTAEITRDTDVFIPLASRANYANELGADRFMSIHANAFGDPQANGTETFSVDEPTVSSELRDLIQEEMIAEWGLRDRGGKTANFTVLTNTAMPATLSELGFVTNTGDAVLLASDAALQRAAEAHVRALERHYGPLPPGSGSIQVDVSLNGEPLSRIPIHVDETEVGETDESGSLVIQDVPVGQYRVRATLPEYEPFELTIVVLANEVAAAMFALEGDLSVDEETGGCMGCSASAPSSFPVAMLLALLYLRRRSLCRV